jgi:hypothetical protein
MEATKLVRSVNSALGIDIRPKAFGVRQDNSIRNDPALAPKQVAARTDGA